MVTHVGAEGEWNEATCDGACKRGSTSEVLGVVLALVTARVARALGPADPGSGSALPSPPPLGSYASPWFRCPDSHSQLPRLHLLLGQVSVLN